MGKETKIKLHNKIQRFTHSIKRKKKVLERGKAGPLNIIYKELETLGIE